MYRQSDLEAYLDESLPPEETARIEKALRADPALLQQLALVQSRRDAGIHSLGGIWRRHRLSCPSREQLGSLLLGALPDEMADYLWFHVNTIGCHYCQANLADLRSQQAEDAEPAQRRQRRYFQSSAGLLRRPS